ncbi:MAG: hypothetical protein A3H32_09425, partial [Betaproteobacteria bacterium RIFCSPLOWO2_02_FULL_63_19]
MHLLCSPARVIAWAFASCVAGAVCANPVGPTVVHGSASFSTAGGTLNVSNSPNAIINWQGFSIGANEATRFIQSGAASSVLNRVTGPESSRILGQLLSNGRVFLINPNGVFIGGGAVVDVAGFVASTLRLSDEDFLAGKFKFDERVGAGNIVNQGAIKTKQGGIVFLVAPNVENNGVIVSPAGEVILAAGKSVQIVNPSSPDVRVEIDAPDNEAVNVSQIIAEGGYVGMFGSIVRQTGLVSANSATVDERGRIVLRAKKKVVLEAGSRTEASGPAGGSVTIEAEQGTVTVEGTVEAKATSTPTVYQLKDPAPIPEAPVVAPVNPEVVPVTASVSIEPPPPQPVRTRGADPTPAPGVGGRVEIIGNDVELRGDALADVSGEYGGGTVLVGGDYQGANADGQNAKTTFVDERATIVADALKYGNGGKAIVWADNATHFVGTLTARGGGQGGNGGFAEVSGKYALYFRGRVDLSARRGVVGTVLFDPDNIQITGGIGDGSDNTDTSDSAIIHTVGITGDASGTGSNTAGSIAFNDEGVPAADPFVVTEKEIEEQSKSANIVLQANKNITVSGTFNYTSSGNAGDAAGVVALADGSSLTLQTRNNATDGAGGVNLTGVEFRTNGVGNISINAGTDGGAAGNATLGTLIAAGTGTITISARGTISQTGSLTAGTLVLTNTGGTTTLNNGSNAIDTLGAMTTTGGAFSLSNTKALLVDGTVNATGQSFSVDAGANAVSFSAINVTAGTLALTGSDVDGLDNIGTLSATTVTLAPDALSGTIGLAVSDGATFTLTTADIAKLKAGASNVTVGATGQTGALTLGADVDLAGKNLTLNGGQLSDTTNKLLANALTLNLTSSGGANSVLTAVSTLNADTHTATGATNQSLTVAEDDGVALGVVNAGAGTLSLTAAGAVTQTGSLTADTLVLTNTAGDTTLDNGSNAIAKLGAIDAGSNVFTLTDNVSGGLTQTGSLTAATLVLTNTAGATTLDHASNAIGVLGAIDATGQAFTLVDNVAGGLTQSGSLIADTLVLTNTAGDTTLNNGSNAIAKLGAIDAGSNVLTLTDNVAGGLTQTGSLTAGTLVLTNTGGATTLSNGSNAIDKLGAMTTTGGAFSLSNTAALLVDGTVNATGQSFSVDAGANAVSFSAINVTAGTLALTGSDVDGLDNIGTLSATTVTLAPNALSGEIGLGVSDAAAFTLTATDIAKLKAGASNVTVGATGQTGALTLGADVDLAGKNLTLNGGLLSDTTRKISANTLTLNLAASGGPNSVKTAVSTLNADTSAATG